MSDIPKKLKHDAIVEAVVEIQFEHSQMAEVVVGRLAAEGAWSGYQTERLPLGDFPAPIRDQDPNLRYQPIVQLVRPKPGEVVKIGAHVLSLHALKPYPGWSEFSLSIDRMIDALANVCGNPDVRRMGLRYINSMSSSHGISSLWDLDIDLTIGGERPQKEFMSAYKFNPSAGMGGQVSLASPEYVTGNVLADSVAYIDVDIFTATAPGPMEPDGLKQWMAEAHDAEKEAFFALWPANVLAALREE